MTLNLNKIDQIIREVGITEIMPRFRKLLEGDVEMKGVDDPVTVADKESERRLTEDLTAALPNSIALGEESFAKDPQIMSRLDSDQPVWVIDPIDGTRNFVAGTPEFAVMVGLVQNRQTIASWIHDPNTGDTIMAEQGAGIWLKGKRLKLAASDTSISTVGLMGSRVKKLLSDPSVMPQGSDLPEIQVGSCAGFDYPRLFSGDVSFANSTKSRAGFLLYRHTNAWDHIPGMFLHKEAGGYSANWSGQPYDMTNSHNGLLFTPNKETWLHLRNLFDPLILHALSKAP